MTTPLKHSPPRLTNPVGWFEIYVTDLQRAGRFYEAVLQRPLTPAISDGTFEALEFKDQQMPGSGAMGALMKHPMRQPSIQGTMVYFSCDDCGITAEMAIQHGGIIHKPKWSIGDHGFIAIIGDTEGNAIGLHSFN
jgi:predicted enzyme related to lactoylglutathione lyase